MEGRWERLGMPLLQWLAVPASVFAFGYFVIGPVVRGDINGDSPKAEAAQAAEQEPIQPGPRKWTPVSPPQVNITVTPKFEEEEEIPEEVPIEDPDAVPPPDSTSGAGGDEAGVGGMQAPPVKKSEETTTTGGDGGAFKGLGGGLG